MTPENIDPLLDSVAFAIRQQSAAAYARFRELLAQGIAPQVAIRQIVATFNPAYYLALSAAFEQLLGQRWPVEAMKNYRVGKVTLSQLLYRQWDITGRAVTAMVNNHAKGLQQAKDFALELYTGYGLNPGEPLTWSRQRVALLPKPLRQLVTSPGVRNVLEDAARRASVGRLRTKALKAAYAQLVETELVTAAGPAFDNALRVALEEKMRYFANRIAQTELARAHAEKVAAEFMDDDTIEVVQWRLSGAHPRADICDLFAKVDRFGLGPGCYPKAQAPRPIAHPFCRCRLRSRPDLSAAGAVEDPEAERKLLGRYSERDAARLVGSRQKLAAVQGGKEARDVWNEGKDERYQVRILGETVGWQRNIGSNQLSQVAQAVRVPSLTIPDVLIIGPPSAIQSHRLYSSAKSGDIVSASEFVREVMVGEPVSALLSELASKRPNLIAVTAVEAGSVNEIPQAMVDLMAERSGLPVIDSIVQANRAGHTKASGWTRLANQAVFDGPVIEGATYWIFDDFVGQGGTMANLLGHIESKGGHVIGLTSLTGKDFSAKLALSHETLAALRVKHGELENWWINYFGFGFESLTESEARYILKAEDADVIRSRLAEAAQ